MSNAVILTDVTGGIGTVTLNKPWKLNAWDTPMRAEITAVLNGWNRDPAVKAVIMTGRGRARVLRRPGPGGDREIPVRPRRRQLVPVVARLLQRDPRSR